MRSENCPVKARTNLSEELAAEIDAAVERGEYASRAEAIRAAVRREVRQLRRGADQPADDLRSVYRLIRAGRRPEALDACRRLADRMGVPLDAEVMLADD